MSLTHVLNFRRGRVGVIAITLITMRKLFLAITALSIFFISCNSSPNQEKNKPVAPVFADTSVQLFSKENPVINLNIKYINDAYKFEKQLGSKISYFPRGVDLCDHFPGDNDPWWDSIIRRPTSHLENPQYVIFQRLEKYDFPLNVIYEYNPKTRIVSYINYEWAPHWIHYDNDFDLDTAIENYKIDFADMHFYDTLFVKLFNVVSPTFHDTLTGLDIILERKYYENIVDKNIETGLNNKMVLESYNTPSYWSNNDYIVRLQLTQSLEYINCSVNNNTINKKMKYRGLILSFLLKKNAKYDK